MDEPPSTWARITHPIYLYPNKHLSVPFVFFTATHLCVCFILLGVCASDYLCPIVVSLTNQRTKPHKGVLAALLLAWCNSSPDLFSNLMSWSSANNAAALSIGEVLGACGVIICVVQGAIFMVMKSAWINLKPYERHSIVMDLLFTLLSVCIIGYVCIVNEVTILNCVVMIIVYATYVVFKVSMGSPQVPMIEVSTPVITENQTVPEMLGPYSDSDDIGSQYFITELDTGIKPSLLTSMDYTNLLKVLEGSLSHDNADTISLETMAISRLDQRPVTEPSDRPDIYNTVNSAHTAPPMFRPYSDDPDLQYPIMQQNRSAELFKRRVDQLKSSALYMLVPQLVNFNEKGYISQAILVILMPFMILLRITIPQYDTMLEVTHKGLGVRFPRKTLLMSLAHAILAPLWSLLLVMTFTGGSPSIVIWLLALCVSLVLLAGCFACYNERRLANTFSLTNVQATSVARTESIAKTVAIVFNIVGVCCSILWISYLANTLIEIMVLYQRITNISEAILGLTIFSWGNSVSDLMSNVAMAKLYHKLPSDDGSHLDTRFLTISLGACLGGVLLNTMIGIGMSGLVAMAPAKRWSIVLRDDGIDTKFLVSGVAIILQVVFLLWLFLTNARFLQSHMRAVGMAMCAWWLAATLLNLILEISV